MKQVYRLDCLSFFLILLRKGGALSPGSSSPYTPYNNLASTPLASSQPSPAGNPAAGTQQRFTQAQLKRCSIRGTTCGNQGQVDLGNQEQVDLGNQEQVHMNVQILYYRELILLILLTNLSKPPEQVQPQLSFLGSPAPQNKPALPEAAKKPYQRYEIEDKAVTFFIT